jgi:hypothetical protein
MTSEQDTPVPTFPWPVGTLVRGWYKDSGGPLRISCEHHVFEIVTEAKPVEWGNSGFCQSARCLYCEGPPTAQVDAYFWWTKVTPGELVDFLGKVEAAIWWFEDLKDRVHDVLRGKPKKALRDFG